MKVIREVDFPYLNESFAKNNFVKHIILLHILPYLLKPKSIETIRKFQLPILFKTQLMLLNKQQTLNKKQRLKINALEGKKVTDKASDYYAYKIEYDFYNSLGGDEALLDAYTLNDIRNFICNKAQYLMAVHSLVKTYISMWVEYSDDQLRKVPSWADCYRLCQLEPDIDNPSMGRSRFAEYQVLGRKALEEGAYKEFKNSSHLIYGYVEALLQKGVIPEKVEGNKKTFIDGEVAKILCSFEKNSALLSEILKHSLYAQKYLIGCVHPNSSRDLDLWLLPEKKLKDNYGIVCK